MFIVFLFFFFLHVHMSTKINSCALHCTLNDEKYGDGRANLWFKVVCRGHDTLSHGNVIICRGHEIVFEVTISLCHGLEMLWLTEQHPFLLATSLMHKQTYVTIATRCSVDLSYPVRFSYLPLKQWVVQFDNEKCYLFNYVLLMCTLTTTLNISLQ